MKAWERGSRNNSISHSLSSASWQNDAPPKMTTLDYEIWQDFIEQQCGLHFSAARQRFLRQRLWERMQACRIQRYNDYYHYVAFNPDGKKEWQQLLPLLLNHETSFFRHEPSFTALKDYVLPQLVDEKRRHNFNVLSMWSVGCSTGQEPYSMAITFLEMMATASFERRYTDWQVSVLGSDISQNALNKARRGRYKTHEIRYMPEIYRDTYLKQIQDNGETFYQVVDKVQAMVQFDHLNLFQADSYPPPLAQNRQGGGQDIIFCQNVLIYFELESRRKIVERLCYRLNPGGYLFLAPAELVGLKLSGIQPVRLTDSLIYRRVSG